MSGRPNRFVSIGYGFLPLLVAAAVLFVLVIVGGKAAQSYEMRQEARALELRVEQLRKDSLQLSQQLGYYRSDDYIEKVAREELGLVRPGDVAVAIVPSEDRGLRALLPTPTPRPTKEKSGREVANWQRWLTIFAGRD